MWEVREEMGLKRIDRAGVGKEEYAGSKEVSWDVREEKGIKRIDRMGIGEEY